MIQSLNRAEFDSIDNKNTHCIIGIHLTLKRECMMNVRILPPHLPGQHADRALAACANLRKAKLAAGEYIENASGAKLERVELMHLPEEIS
jgi:hypothetical protein